jgi:hypothetical protein
MPPAPLLVVAWRLPPAPASEDSCAEVWPAEDRSDDTAPAPAPGSSGALRSAPPPPLEEADSKDSRRAPRLLALLRGRGVCV